MTVNNPKVIYPNPNPNSLTNPTNPPYRAAPYTLRVGLQLIYPLQKQYVTGALRRVFSTYVFNLGNALADSTLYRGWIPVPRNATVTGAWALAGVAPSAGANTVALLSGGSAGTSVLSAATQSVTAIAANTIFPLTLAAVPDLYNATLAPPPLYVAWQSGVQSTAAVNAAVIVEFELDDF